MRKTRAQRDAEQLQALEQAQQRIDSGEVSVEEVEASLTNEDAGENEQPFEQQIENEQIVNQQEEEKHDDSASLREEIANLKRMLGSYEYEQTATKRRASELEQELQEAKAQLTAKVVLDSHEDYGLTEEEQEFETVKSISEKITKAQMSKLLKELENIKSKMSNYENEKTQMSVEAEIAKHRNELSKALGGENPDELFAHPKIASWIEGVSDEEANALRNPILFSPKFVAGVLTRFKSEVMKGQVKREPSHGEAAVPSRVAPDVMERKGGPNDDSVVFNPRTFQADVQKLISQGKTAEAEKLVQMAERATSA